MAFYDLDKPARAVLSAQIAGALEADLRSGHTEAILRYYADEDTYVRKVAYVATGRLYRDDAALEKPVLHMLAELMGESDFRIRQTVVNAAGEIGKKDFDSVRRWFDEGLFDKHPSVRNAVIGSVKKACEVNPLPLLAWARGYLHHPDKEVRREICHGIELRGRRYPEDILPLLRALQWDATARVRKTLVHVLGQIAYKKGCLEKVVADLLLWEHRALVQEALTEIIDVHHRYRSFAALSQEEAVAYIDRYFNRQ